MRFPPGPGFGAFGGILEDIIAGIFFLVCFAIVVGVLFVLVRFLLVATRAAEIYVAKNGATPPAADQAVAPAAPSSPAVPTAAPTAPVAKPSTTTRTRTPKPPTTL